MNFAYILDKYLLNLTDEYSGFQYYNICKHAALIDKDGKILASSKFFSLTKEEFETMKFIYNKFHQNLKIDSNEPDFHTKDQQDIKLSICNENYLVVHFDYDKNDLYLSRTRSGGVISFEEKTGIFIIGLFSEILKMQNIDGVEESQNLGTVIRAVDHTRKYISKTIS